MKRFGKWLVSVGTIGALLMFMVISLMFVNDCLLRYDTVIDAFMSVEMMNTVIPFSFFGAIMFAMICIFGLVMSNKDD
jgi:hypothetical protein